MKKIVSLVVLLLAAQALHADDTFSWTYGGGTDPVHAYGTLEATPDPFIVGAYDILGGSGTRVDNTGTYEVTIVPFSLSNDPAQCAYSPAGNCTVVASGGVSADLIFDNLLYANNPVGSQIDGGGFVISEPTGPYATYFSVWDAGVASYVGPPDLEFDPYFYTSTTLANPFEVTLISSGGPSANDLTATPEPGSWLLLGTGLLGLAVLLYRKATPACSKLHS